MTPDYLAWWQITAAVLSLAGAIVVAAIVIVRTKDGE